MLTETLDAIRDYFGLRSGVSQSISTLNSSDFLDVWYQGSLMSGIGEPDRVSQPSLTPPLASSNGRYPYGVR